MSDREHQRAGDLFVFRQEPLGDDPGEVTSSLTAAFVAIREALEAGRPVVIVVDAADLEGQGTSADAAVATGLLGMVRTLGIEGAKPGWRVNVLARDGDDEAGLEETATALAGTPLTGQLLQAGGANLGKVAP